MGEKPKISANGTYVFDPDELDELDDLSLTSVMGEVSESIEELRKKAEEASRANDAEDAKPAERLSDPSIDALLEESADGPAPTEAETEGSKARTDQSPDELLSPDLMFSDTDSDGDKDA